jgi:type IV pilus assembly protein PilO
MAPPAAGGSALAKLPLGAKIGAGGALVGIVAFTYWFIFYADTSKKIDAAILQRRQLESQLAAQQQAHESYIADKAELELRTQRTRDFNKVLPPDKEQPEFLAAVQQAATSSGVNIVNYAFLDEQPQAFYVKDPMRVEVTGKFHQVTKFMYEIGKLDRVINMENVELINPKIQGDEVDLHSKALATAFHAPKPAGGAPK